VEFVWVGGVVGFGDMGGMGGVDSFLMFRVFCCLGGWDVIVGEELRVFGLYGRRGGLWGIKWCCWWRRWVGGRGVCCWLKRSVSLVIGVGIVVWVGVGFGCGMFFWSLVSEEGA